MDSSNMDEASPGGSLEETEIVPDTNVSEDVPNSSETSSGAAALDQSKLFSIAAQLEAELEAFHFVLSSFKVSLIFFCTQC